MHSKLLVDANQFMTDLDKTIRGAKESVQVQAMTFEGDQAGRQLIDALMASKAIKKQLLIDSYSKVVINDQFVFGPGYWSSSSLRKEVKETKQMLQVAIENGIEVKFTNPVGFMMHRYPLRNHKKMVIVDKQIAYIGGINFSEHNFEWHDAMIRIEDQKIGMSLSQDFLSTWSGVNQSKKVSLEETTLYFVNGSKSRELYEDFFEIIDRATKSIDIFSPYVSDPLLKRLKGRSNKKVRVRVISSKENNKSIFKKNLNNELKKGYFELWHYLKGMSHLKAILIDEETLIMGSSNFDVVSYYFEQEVIMVSKNPGLIADFMKNIYAMDLKESIKVNPGDIKASKTASFFMQSLNWVVEKGASYILSTR